MNACVEKNFVRVEVANTREESLVHQNRFHRATTFAQYFSELLEINSECVGPQFVLFQKRVDIL